MSEKRYELSEETAWIQVKDIRKAMPVLAAIFYRDGAAAASSHRRHGNQGKDDHFLLY